ncbi:hypothetical protein HPB50_026571 [Hyalomma asiaticum]|uniref:Uncharacterized protein n=1 Tax=Hyalomma asiaticum TaxID=266040 RepID=A0ACB7TPI8_HYAAI|nr:hypothetical protein HPB50_026571 [Hyalomma asiaticum]
MVNGRQYAEGDTVPSDERDPCVVCLCKDGRVTCTKKSCPVLPCPPSRIAQTPGTCCPECRNSVVFSKVFRDLTHFLKRCGTGRLSVDTGYPFRQTNETFCRSDDGGGHVEELSG